MPNTTIEQRSPVNTRKRPLAAPSDGTHGVFACLVSEHQEVLMMLRKLREIREDDTKTRRNLWAEIARALVAHERAELQEVYKTFAIYPSLMAMVDEHARYVHSLEALVDELDAVPMHTAGWRLTFQRLETLVREHAVEEESTFFPRAQSVIGNAKAKLMEVPYLSAKRLLLKVL